MLNAIKSPSSNHVVVVETATTTTAIVMLVVLLVIGAIGTSAAAQLSSAGTVEQQISSSTTSNEQQHHHKTRHHHHNRHHQQDKAAAAAASSASNSNESAASLSSDNLNEDYDPLPVEDSDLAVDYSSAGGATGGGIQLMSNCSSCVAGRDELRRRNLELIKDQILSKLGMRQAPNMTGRLPPRIPPLDHLLDLYGMQSDGPYSSSSSGGSNNNNNKRSPFHPGPVYDEEEDDFHARTEKVIAFAQTLPLVSKAMKKLHSKGGSSSSSIHPESPPPSSMSGSGKPTSTTTTTTATKGMESMFFKFSDKVTRTSKVDKAHLWLYLNGASSPSASTTKIATNISVWIHVYKVVRVDDEGESPVLNPVRSTKVALQEKGGWVSLEMRKVVADWFRFPEDNQGLVVHAVFNIDPSSSDAHLHQHKTTQQLVVIDSNSDQSLMPFVEVVTSDSRKHRTKRTIGLNCDETSIETRCCRYPLTVDFVEFGWDWIIAPKKYEANYCSGECPYVFLQKYPHTHIVQQANPAGTAGPCCAPRKMSSISMLYFDNEFNIIYGNLPGMVVDRCGCS